MRHPRSHPRAALVPAFAVAAAVVLGACDDGDEADETGSVIVTTDPVPSASATGSAQATGPDVSPAATVDVTATVTTAPIATTVTTTITTAITTTATTNTDTTVPVMGDPVVAFDEVVSLERPLDLAWRSGDPTLYVVEQPGRVVAVDAATGSSRVVLDVTDATDAAGERGLLGLEFAASGELAYVNYTDAAGDTVIAEFPVDATGAFDRAAERVLMIVDQPYANHDGGDLQLGPDGLLYIGLGDGGSRGDPERRALDTSTVLGKLLRIDPTPSADQPYTVPDDNPFVGTDGARPEIWSIGLRNPWKFTFDPLTGDLWVADVGQNTLEEVNRVPAPTDGSIAGRSVSFGWSAYEGTERFNTDQPADEHVEPVFTYRHGDDGCSVSGGAPYRGGAIPALSSGYVYGDYCSGRVWALDVVGARNVLLGTPGRVTAVVAGPDGELYVTSARGPVLRIVAG
jgi:glucose/arabinose dehydrogenase